MLKSISHWSFAGDWSMDRRMGTAAQYGYQAYEVALDEDPDGSLRALGFLTVEDMEQQADAIRATADKHGLQIAAVAAGCLWGYPLTDDDPAKRARGVELSQVALRAARCLGTDATLIIPGMVGAPWIPGTPVPYDVCYQRSVEAVKQILPTAEDQQVYMGLEPVWNKFLLSPLEWVQYVDAFDSPWAKVYFDCGNVLLFGYPEQWIRLLGHRICRIHVKDFKLAVGNLSGFCDLLDGDVNWAACMAALREIGYDGTLTAEVMPPNPLAPEHILEVNSLALDRILAM